MLSLLLQQIDQQHARRRMRGRKRFCMPCGDQAGFALPALPQGMAQQHLCLHVGGPLRDQCLRRAFGRG